MDLRTDALPAVIYKNVRVTCHQIGKIQGESDSVINNGLI